MAARADAEPPPGPAAPERDPAGLVALVAILGLATFVIVTALSMLGPLLLELSASFGEPVGKVGLLGAAASLPAAFAALFAGPLTDRFGRRRLLVCAVAGLGLFTALAGAAPTFEAMFALRVLAGFTGGFGPTALLATVGDRVPRARLGWAMGWTTTGFGLAAVVGVPMIAGLAGWVGWRWAFLAVGLLLVGVAPLIARILGGEPARPARRAGGGFAEALAGYRAVLGVRGLAPVLFANVCERTTFTALGLYLAAFLGRTYDLSTAATGPVLALTALGAVAGNVLGGRLSDRGDRALVYAGGQAASALLAPALFLLPAGVIQTALLAAGFGLANAVSRPALLAIASGLSESRRGTAMGMLSSSNQTGWAVGAALGGAALGLADWPGVALLCLLGALLAAAASLRFRGSMR